MEARFCEEKIIGVLRNAAEGTKFVDVCRRHGVTWGPLCRWRKHFSGFQMNNLRRLQLLEEENRRFERILADQELNHQVLEVLLGNRA